MAKKFYAVKRGVRPGVYETWSACEPLVKGFPGAIYKSFPTRQEAEHLAANALYQIEVDGVKEVVFDAEKVKKLFL